jgi:predicted aspartyl protease
MRWSLVLLLFLSLPAAAAPQPVETPEAHAAKLLAAARDSAGGAAWDRVHSLHLVGKQQSGDETSDEDLWLDPNGGRFARALADGESAGRSGFDGSTAWVSDPDGSIRPETGTDRADRISELWWRSYEWARADRARATASWLRDENLAGRAADLLRVTPVGGSVLDVVLDHTSHLPVRVLAHRAGGDVSIRLSDWKRVDGVAVARRIEIEQQAATAAAIETIVTADANSHADAAQFAPPSSTQTDYTFPAETVSVELPMKVLNGHVFISASIAKNRLNFMFDTGSGAALDQASVARLALPTHGDGSASVVKLPDFSVGGVVLHRQTLPVRDLSALAMVEGVPIDGIVGYELLKRLVVELDYDGRRAVLVKPDGFVPPGGITPLPLSFIGRMPFVSGRLDGLPIRLAVDTGSGVSLTVNPAFAQAHGLAERWRPVPTLLGWDETGLMRGAIARAASFEIGVQGIAQPLVYLPTQGESAGDARLGGAVLRRFDVIFDYRHGQLWLQPNRTAERPDSYNHAGLWLNRQGDVMQVTAILKDGPADHAGLELGDMVESVGGDKAATLGLPDIRVRLSGQSGDAVNLGVRRKGEYRNVRLILADPLAVAARREP